jgi:hypothetical protein
MKNWPGTAVAFAAGAAVMYLLDPELGAQRRAAMTRWLRPASPGAGDHPPASAAADAQLRDRVRMQLGRLVSYPQAIHVQVNASVVRLSGDVLAAEQDGLLTRVLEIPGVQKVVNALAPHATARSLGDAQDEERQPLQAHAA